MMSIAVICFLIALLLRSSHFTFPENMKSDNADLNNLSKKAAHGGSCTAAAFLENFIEDNVKWAHIDFAGPASFTQSRNYYPKGKPLQSAWSLNLLVRAC